MSDPIKVGIIRCDTHGAYYAPLMAPHDPYKLQRPIAPGEESHYSWMTGGAHFYFYHSYSNPAAISVDTVDGFKIVNVWDEHRRAAEVLCDVMDDHPRVCDSFEQVSEGVDLIFIGDCNGDGSDHLEHATPGLEKGIATYVDKPMANTVEDVKKIMALSKKHSAPVFSGSILRHIPTAQQFARRMDDIGGANSGIIRGGGCHIAGQVHTVSLAQAVFGSGISEVHACGPGEVGMMHLSWGDREDRPACGVAVHHNVTEVYHSGMHVAAFGRGGGILAENNINDYHYPWGAANILRHIKHMVLTGEVHESMNDMIEAVAVVNAGRLSYKEGGRAVQVDEVR